DLRQGQTLYRKGRKAKAQRGAKAGESGHHLGSFDRHFLLVDLALFTAHNPVLRLVLTLAGRRFRTFGWQSPGAKFRLISLVPGVTGRGLADAETGGVDAGGGPCDGCGRHRLAVAAHSQLADRTGAGRRNRAEFAGCGLGGSERIVSGSWTGVRAVVAFCSDTKPGRRGLEAGG